MEIIYPRSPRETMAGWVYLPRFVDKIRLHLAGRLHPDYQPNFTKGFDAMWLEAAGVSASDFIAMVKETITDGQVADWVRLNVRKTDADKAAHREKLFNRGLEDEETRARVRLRKEQYGLAQRDDIRTFVDIIEADEHRI